jgi:predicted 3-demethylubiquinone-9 3-methyltransferase (glyoxalase superfamily)
LRKLTRLELEVNLPPSEVIMSRRPYANARAKHMGTSIRHILVDENDEVFHLRNNFQVRCETQGELDYYWEKLSEGGDEQAQQCGWLKDKYGVSWQVIPTVLLEMVHDADAEKSQRVMKAILQMKKIDIEKLKRAYDG